MNAPALSAALVPIQVMVVDDSAVIRGLLVRALETDPGIKVLSSVPDGVQAIAALKRQPVDVIVLDIEMPNMDGLTALPHLLHAQPGVQIIMASTLTHRNAEISMKALALGAADYIPKPSASKDLMSGQGFTVEFLEKVRALGGAAQRRKNSQTGSPDFPAPSEPQKMPANLGAPLVPPAALRPAAPGLFPGKSVNLRPMPRQKPDALALGSSTGGPQALLKVFKDLGKDIPQPVFITQHMPASFTKLLAEHITKEGGFPCAEAIHGEVVQGGRAYLAPGDFHMTVERKGVSVHISLNQAPPENFCRPAVDPMLRSLSAIYGPRIFCAILTGMGHDGAKGGEVLVQAGGAMIAQDEASSVVWGMPGAAATAGICSGVYPLLEIGPLMRRMALTGAA